jgi:hypothetical protein
MWQAQQSSVSKATDGATQTLTTRRAVSNEVKQLEIASSLLRGRLYGPMVSTPPSLANYIAPARTDLDNPLKPLKGFSPALGNAISDRN